MEPRGLKPFIRRGLVERGASEAPPPLLGLLMLNEGGCNYPFPFEFLNVFRWVVKKEK